MSSTATGTDDPALVAPYAQPMRLDHGTKTPWCVVLFHGLTNNPYQFSALAPQIFARGANVLVPRMAFHGYADRLTNALARLEAEMLIDEANAAVDEAKTRGERVAVLGISMGGLVCAHLAQHRADVALSIPIAPDFGLLRFPGFVTRALGALALRLPNAFFWWDPRVKDAMLPATAYPRCATRALFQTIRLGNGVFSAAASTGAAAGRIRVVVNPNDPAVNNAVTRAVFERWQRLRGNVDYVELTGLPVNHDIIDPGNPLQQTALVYPKLLELLSP
jgi:pimeloyl-ACP methyl ester carboxylesterase